MTELRIKASTAKALYLVATKEVANETLETVNSVLDVMHKGIAFSCVMQTEFTRFVQVKPEHRSDIDEIAHSLTLDGYSVTVTYKGEVTDDPNGLIQNFGRLYEITVKW